MTSANNKFRKTATVAGMAIAISVFSALPAAAQMADGQSVLTQLRIQTVQAPPSTLSPSDLERFKTLLREEQDRVKSSSWTLVEAQPGRIRLADLTENSEHIGKITARDLVLSGLRAEGGSFVIERAEMAGVNIVEKDGDYITAEDIVYGPINVSNSGLDNLTGMFSASAIPEFMQVNNITMSEAGDDFTADFMGVGKSPSGTGYALGIQNMQGTTKSEDTGKPIFMSVREMSGDGFDAASVANLINVGNETDKFNLDKLNYSNISLLDFKIKGDGISMDIGGLVANNDTTAGNGIIKSKITMLPATMRALPDAEKDIREGFAALGVDSLTFSGVMNTTYDPKAETLKIADSHLNMTDWFKLGFAYDFSDVDATDRGLPQVAKIGKKKKSSAADDVDFTFDYAKIAIKDLSGVDKVLGIYAKSEGKSVAEVRKQASAMLLLAPILMAEDPEMQRLAQSGGKSLSSFMNNGGTIVMEMDPKKGITRSDLEKLRKSDPKKALRKMNMSISHTE